MGELLREGPVEPARVGARDDRAVQLDLELDVERPVALGAQVLERLRLLRRGGHAVGLERGKRGDPRCDRGGERLAQERAERYVLPALDVARAPVVDEREPEDVCGGVRSGEPRPGRAGDEAELELDVEPSAGSEGRAAVGRELALRAGDGRARGCDGAG